MTRTIRLIALSCLALPCIARQASADDFAKDKIKLTVEAGSHHRAENTPIRFLLPEDRLGPLARKALDQGPISLLMQSRGDGTGGPVATTLLAQVERTPEEKSVLVTFLLPDRLRREEVDRFWLNINDPRVWDSPTWTFTEKKPGVLDLKRGDKPVFTYNAAPVSSPNYGPIQVRDAYIHPAYSPSGALITGDFSSSHPHHRGFFLAYEKTKTGDLAPDFWNIHQGTGKIHSEGFDKPVVGPVTARFSARHRWEAIDKAAKTSKVVLSEKWDVETYDIPGAPYWLFDITSTQQAVDRPLELLPYRYGGMAYRGPEPFVKGTLDVLTSEGLNRRDGDQKPARWVDLTGPIADGSDKYAGAMIADHPSNPHYPTVARIHPTTLPFFCFVPAHDKPVTIGVDKPTVFRYRVLIHDSHPDKGLDERVVRDFAEPPVVTVE